MRTRHLHSTMPTLHSTIASSSTTSCIFNLPPKNPYSHLIRNHQNPPQNHESVLTSQPLIPELTQTLGAIITAQLGSLTDLEIYIAAAVQGMQSRGSVGRFVWLVMDVLGCLGVVATYSTGMLLVAECRQSLTPDGVELSGIYEPAMPVLLKSVSLLSSSCTLSLTSLCAMAYTLHRSHPDCTSTLLPTFLSVCFHPPKLCVLFPMDRDLSCERCTQHSRSCQAWCSPIDYQMVVLYRARAALLRPCLCMGRGRVQR
jgi:hypothetical protein